MANRSLGGRGIFLATKSISLLEPCVGALLMKNATASLDIRYGTLCLAFAAPFLCSQATFTTHEVIVAVVSHPFPVDSLVDVVACGFPAMLVSAEQLQHEASDALGCS